MIVQFNFIFQFGPAEMSDIRIFSNSVIMFDEKNRGQERKKNCLH